MLHKPLIMLYSSSHQEWSEINTLDNMLTLSF